MRPFPSARARRLLAPAAAVACLAAMAPAAAAPAAAAPTAAAPTAAAPTVARTAAHRAATPSAAARVTGPHGRGYLALGDSVSFGYREPANKPTPDYSDASSFVGFPELVARALHLKVANASCPGETSGSLLSSRALSFTCRLTPTGRNGYRTKYPLHVSYRGTQLQYALRYLASHPHTRLITLLIGANDGYLCQVTTSDQCASEFPAVLSTLSKHVTLLLKTLRNRAHYRGQIVIVQYYATDYRDAFSRGSSQALNSTVAAAAQPFRVRIAHSYGLFRRAAVQTGGNTCAAGLLTILTTGGCGVHPSVAGQALLAQAVEQVVSP